MQTAYLLSLLILSCSFALSAQSTFLEKDGIVRIDLQSADDLGQWVLKDTISGASGGDYLEFEGPNFFNTPGRSTLTYKVRIGTVGTYQFRWHSRITEPGENTEFNDSWLRCPDASDFYGQRSGSTVYPKGSGRTPTPEGSGSGGWFKVYQNRADRWTWQASTSDNDPHSIFVAFDAPGDYTVEISGRSFGHAIDRFVLIHSSASPDLAQQLGQPESERVTTAVSSRVAGRLAVSPNPVTDHLLITLPAELGTGTYSVEVRDTAGRVVLRKQAGRFTGGSFRLQTGDLPAGGYVVNLLAEGRVFVARFLK